MIWADPAAAGPVLVPSCSGCTSGPLPWWASRPSPFHLMATPAVSRGLAPEGAMLFLREQVPCATDDGRGGAGQPFWWGVTNAPSRDLVTFPNRARHASLGGSWDLPPAASVLW